LRLLSKKKGFVIFRPRPKHWINQPKRGGDMQRLRGKSALITGAAQGIGRGFAQAYVAEGAAVAIADVNLDAAMRTASEIGSAAYAVEMDVTDQASIDAAIATVVARQGKLDIVINNAALFDAAQTVDITRASFEKLYAVNVAGTLFTMQAAARQMIRLVAVYCSTKAAVISLTQSAGLNLIQHGINVNAIAPGVVDGVHWDHVDAMFAKLEHKKPGQKKAEVAAGVPAGRFAVPADLAGMAIFLASEESDYIVSQTYNVDGGQWMS
jgi:NAD(P)-dependent dehydrogenase (short-subunit alcohol dehydrogenase family)